MPKQKKSIWLCESCYNSLTDNNDVECFTDIPILPFCEYCKDGKAKYHVVDIDNLIKIKTQQLEKMYKFYA